MILAPGRVHARFKNSIVTYLKSIVYDSFFDSGVSAFQSEIRRNLKNATQLTGALLKNRVPMRHTILACIAALGAVFQAPLPAQTVAWSWPWPSGKSGPPVISSISPASAAQGTKVDVTITGSNFDPTTGVRLAGGGARQGNVVFVSPTTVTATFTFLPTTAVGTNNVYVVTANGNSNILPFSVMPASTQTVSLSPAAATVFPSGTQQLSAAVTGPGNQALTWSLTPNIGSLTVQGNNAVYSAPSVIFAPQSVVVTAQSVSQPSASDSTALLLVPNVTLSLSAPSGPLYPSGTQAFTASILDATNSGVTWTLSPNVGTLTVNGTSAVYAAPSTINSPQNVTVSVQSNAQPSVVASQSMQLSPAASISINPPSATVYASGSQSFRATVNGVTNTGVTWSFSPNVGSLTTNGRTAVYTAPSAINAPQTITVTAQSNAQPSLTTSAALLLSPPVTLSLNAPSGTLYPSDTQAFTASLVDASNSGVTWSLSPNVGTLTINGNSALYTAPPTISSPRSVTVTVKSNAQTSVVASQTMQLSPPVSISLNPPGGTIFPSGTQSFTATVNNTANTGVTWSFSPNVGSLTTSGNTAVYTAPQVINTAQTITVTAQSNAQASVSASSTLQLTPQVTLSVSPGAVTLNPTATQQFTATVQGTTNTGVTWSLQPKLGTISASGLYAAPSSLPANGSQTVTVTATSAQDATVSSSAQITITTGVMFTMGPTGLSSLTYNGQSFLYRPNVAPYWVNVFQTDPSGNSTSVGSVPSQTAIDPVANTITQTFGWGTSITQYQSSGNKLIITMSLTNTLSNPITRYWMFPLGIKLPATPLNFSNNVAFSMDSPASVFFDYGTGTVDLVDEDIVNPMATMFWQATNPPGPAWLLSLYVDPGQHIGPSWPLILRPIAPGGSDTITISLRFGGPGMTEPQLVSDLFARYAATFPRLLPPAAPRQPIARLSFSGTFRPTLPNNPRGWLNDPTIDVTTPAGIAAFQQEFLQAADTAIAEMTRVGARGGIIWDIEGQQFDQSFIGDPTQAEAIAPELVGVIDPFIAKFRNAGFQIGFDIEPRVLTFTKGSVSVLGTQVTLTGGTPFSPAWVGQPGGGEITIGNNNYWIASVQSPTSLTLLRSAPTQNNVPYIYPLEVSAPNAEADLTRKVAYTRNRWGATLFYVDNDLLYGSTLLTPPKAFDDMMQLFPGTLFFPEWAGTRHYAYTYPFLDSTNGITEPRANVMAVYPQAAGLVRVPNDQNIQAAVPALIQSVSTGNILLFDGWYYHPGNDTVMQIYQQAP